MYTPCGKLHGEKKVQVEEQLRQWTAEKVIERCDSNWASPIHAVMKPNSSWRVCGDFRRLNAMTKLDRYPLPALTTFNERLFGLRARYLARLTFGRRTNKCTWTRRHRIKQP